MDWASAPAVQETNVQSAICEPAPGTEVEGPLDEIEVRAHVPGCLQLLGTSLPCAPPCGVPCAVATLCAHAYFAVAANRVCVQRGRAADHPRGCVGKRRRKLDHRAAAAHRRAAVQARSHPAAALHSWPRHNALLPQCA